MCSYKKSASLLVVLNLAMLFGCQTNIDLSQSDKEAIRQVDEEFVSAWFKEDSKEAVLNVFADDAVFIPHHGVEPVKGKENLKAFFWPEGQSGIVHNFNHYPTDIEGTKNVAWVRGRHNVKYSWIIDGDTTTTVNKGNYVSIMRNYDNLGWKISTFIFNDPVADIVDQ